MALFKFKFLLSRSHIPAATLKRWTSSKNIRKINKLLIANRGEIACRVMRTAELLGIRTVAVYSDADEHAVHVSMANEAYRIGPPVASQSYLKGDKLIEIAKKSNCDALHPGYGFLSENVEFAEKCQKSGIIFIGPPSTAIHDMGIKSTSKAIMAKAGVPIIAGYLGDDQSNSNLKKEANRIGYPIMIKAVRGGGGKGMRIVHNENDFEEALESARSESKKAFNDSIVLLEKFIGEPRHVEVQVFADQYGNAIYLYERDCSVQRRHQKIIEEAPAPGLSEELRRKLGEAAVKAAKAVGYVSAGTVEFILDRKTHDFHFMEMNTRLQVEHPITEMITGTDLVEWQIKIAAGETLPLKQEDVPLKGHAFEARIYAEDPRDGFLPGAGPLRFLSTPEASNDVRIETGVQQGDEVSVHYDPMIAKLVVWGKERGEALTKLQAKLLEFNVAGLETNVNFLLDLSKHPEFVLGNVHTNFIADHNNTLFKPTEISNEQLIQAAVAVVLNDEIQKNLNAQLVNDNYNPFCVEKDFRINSEHVRDIKFKIQETEKDVKVKSCEGMFQISLDGGNSWTEVRNTKFDKNILSYTANGSKTSGKVYINDSILALFTEKGKTQFELHQPAFLSEIDENASLKLTNNAIAPMPGVLDKILVKPGDRVTKGDSLFVLIAMKMEHIVKASRDANITKILYKPGENVLKDTVIVEFEKDE